MTAAPSSTPMLDVRHVDVAYGGIRAVRQLSMQVYPGELVALIGANGAGKSTTLRAICGLVPLAAGRIHYQGQSLAGQPVHAMVRQGLVMVPEGRGIFPQLTIEENLHMGAYSRSDKALIVQEVEQVYARFPRLAERRKQTAGTLSGGEQQMLAMGRAILSKPKLLLLDEPVAGMTDDETARTAELFLTLKGKHSLMVVEHDMSFINTISEKVTVLCDGSVLAEGTLAQVQADERVIEVYLGR